MTLLLDAGTVARLLDFDVVVPAIEAACALYSRGDTVSPPRTSVSLPDGRGVLLTMPCAIPPLRALGTKLVSVFPGNRERGVATVQSLYVLSRDDTGEPLAVMDGAYITAMRTAAASAVATARLARSDAHTLGIFGTGVQARFHVRAIASVRDVERVLVVATSDEKANSFVRWIEESLGIDAEPASPSAASSADVVATCTTSPTPVVVADQVRDGAHINAVGAFSPTTRELPDALIRRARVYVDTSAGAFAEAGDLLIPVQEGAFSLDSVAGELGEVVLGLVAGRQSAGEITLYKSVGAPFMDAATARLAFDRALAEGAGQSFSFG